MNFPQTPQEWFAGLSGYEQAMALEWLLTIWPDLDQEKVRPYFPGSDLWFEAVWNKSKQKIAARNKQEDQDG